MTATTALTAEHGPDLVLTQEHGVFIVWKPGGDRCRACRTCLTAEHEDLMALDGHLHVFPGFVVCPECGDKRCPHGDDHREACTHAPPEPPPGRVRRILPITYRSGTDTPREPGGPIIY